MRSTARAARLGWTDTRYVVQTGAFVGGVGAAIAFFIGMVLFLAR
ncbi:MAG TPA: hypothetical protein VFP65_27815 [Anaeromyxobacteraceae bacterium]|nr:hypothetical protein [Anaeromyxobacteraceae bacterium]